MSSQAADRIHSLTACELNNDNSKQLPQFGNKIDNSKPSWPAKT